jgi:hypothetical protein
LSVRSDARQICTVMPGTGSPRALAAQPCAWFVVTSVFVERDVAAPEGATT